MGQRESEATVPSSGKATAPTDVTTGLLLIRHVLGQSQVMLSGAKSQDFLSIEVAKRMERNYLLSQPSSVICQRSHFLAMHKLRSPCESHLNYKDAVSIVVWR